MLVIEDIVKMGSIAAEALPVKGLSFEKFENVIAGSLRGGKEIHHGVNPSNKSLLWDVPIATENDLDEAVDCAREAFKTWSKTSWASRQTIIKQMREELKKHIPEFAKMLGLEGGKPVSTSLPEMK